MVRERMCTVGELRGAGWYTRVISDNLPSEAFKPVPRRLWWGVLFLTWAAVPIGLVWVLDLPIAVNFSLSLLIGMGFAGLGFLGHEILHGSVVRTAWLRDLLGAIAFGQFMLGPKLWRKWHNMEHHAHTQDEHTDPDAMGTMEQFYRRPGLRFLYRLPPWIRSTITFLSFSFFFSTHSLLMLKRYHPVFRPGERRIVLAQLAVPALVWAGLLMAMGPAKWAFAYLIPLMIANFVVICYISTNHQLNPLTAVNDPLANSLSVSVPTWVDVIHLNFSHHTEHHLFPGVNPKWAPLIKAQLKRHFPGQYHEMPFLQALLTLWSTPRLYSHRTELVDPHRGLAYGSLGHGLEPGRSAARPLDQA